MKLVLCLSLLCIGNTFAFAMTDKDPAKLDVSVNTLIDYTCQRSGFINPAACIADVGHCYDKAQWSKTIDVKYKLDVINNCLFKYVR